MRIKMEAIEFCWGAFMLACGDVAGLDQYQMKFVWDKVDTYEKSYLDGNLTNDFLREEVAKYGIHVSKNYGSITRKHGGAITFADLKRAKAEAMRFTWLVFMVSFGECGYSQDQIDAVWKRIHDYEQDYYNGVLSIKMLHDTLREEYRVILD